MYFCPRTDQLCYCLGFELFVHFLCFVNRATEIFMATVASSHNLFCRDNNLSTAKGKREHALYSTPTPPMKRNIKKLCSGIKASSSTKKHLKSLDSCLGKLHDDAKPPSSLNQRSEIIDKTGQLKLENVLRDLDSYLDKVKSDAKSETNVDKDLQASINYSAKKDQGSRNEISVKNYVELKTAYAEEKQISADEASDFYLIGVLTSINIAVYLFEIAAPVKNSDFELFSIPMIYGAKINNFILAGEWWRLVTSMFLHAGIFHIALGIWVLFTFGLEVSRVYGSFTFLLIYVLGGISGNLISFLHTPDPTVGGTGPVFAVIGAWLIYQVQNKDVIARGASDIMFQNAIIATGLNLILSHFGPIDDWAHFGATFMGIAYGFVTCPSIRVNNASPEAASRQERITLVRRYADPCKSLMYFSLSLLLLSSLLFIIEPPLDLIE